MREAQRLAKLPPRYDGCCLAIGSAEAEARARTEPYVVRMKVPDRGTAVIEDLRRGRIEIEWNTVDMQVLMKSDGLPTYHLANVVDDHLMHVTHVIRGEEWVSSAPKHLLLYQYFGWEPPAFLHVPLLRNPDKSKLSKRKNPTSILFYKAMGYLPEALLNFLGLADGIVGRRPRGDDARRADRDASRSSTSRSAVRCSTFRNSIGSTPNICARWRRRRSSNACWRGAATASVSPQWRNSRSRVSSGSAISARCWRSFSPAACT